MPLTNSGSALFAGSADEFVELAPAGRLVEHLTREFNRRWGTVAKTEVDSWRASLTALSDVVASSDVLGAGVGVELKLPLTDKRVDVSFVGHHGNQPTVALVELKQWKSVGPSVFPGNVVVGGLEMVHPAVQVTAYAQYLRDSHSAFSEDGFQLAACAYLHNMGSGAVATLKAEQVGGESTAVFGKTDSAALAGFLNEQVGGGNGMALLPKLVHGRYRPSQSLLDGIAAGLKARPAWTLLDEQRLAYNLVRGYVTGAVKVKGKAVVIVLGGPGTGKSVVAAHLALELNSAGRTAVHATGSKAFTTNLRALVPKRHSASAFFRYFNNFGPAKIGEDGIDVLVADEAHRIRTTSNHRFTPRRQKSELDQVDELIRAAKVSVFFLDERQNVRPEEIGSPQVIRDAAKRHGVALHEVQLTAQFRCNGCGGYIEWVDALMSDTPIPVGNWKEAGEYDLKVFDDVEAMEGEIIPHARAGKTARLVAGFCWPWSDPQPGGELANDVEIGDWRRPWNEKAPEQRQPAGPQPVPNKHPYTLWATRAERVREVGCIYSAQGFEFDYCGVILGDDLVWRNGRGWVGQKAESADPQIARRRLSPEDLVKLLQHTYRVLLTRGIKGTFVYSTDPETREFLARL